MALHEEERAICDLLIPQIKIDNVQRTIGSNSYPNYTWYFGDRSNPKATKPSLSSPTLRIVLKFRGDYGDTAEALVDTMYHYFNIYEVGVSDATHPLLKVLVTCKDAYEKEQERLVEEKAKTKRVMALKDLKELFNVVDTQVDTTPGRKITISHETSKECTEAAASPG
jgi:hypothetical protein